MALLAVRERELFLEAGVLAAQPGVLFEKGYADGDGFTIPIAARVFSAKAAS